jgi:hypothetical protein
MTRILLLIQQTTRKLEGGGAKILIELKTVQVCL